MSIMIYRDEYAAGHAAATVLAAQIIQKPASVLGLSAGKMAENIYQRLAAMTNEGVLDWGELTVFHTGENINRKPGTLGIQSRYLEENLYAHVGMERSRVYAPDHNAQDLQAACIAFEDDIANAGGLDLLLLTIGQNGHLALNSPAREFSALTHVELLSPETIEECKSIFRVDTEISSQAVIMGMSTMMAAKRILLFASGREAAGLTALMLSSSITPSVPASMLQLHPNVLYMLDEDAAAGL